MIGAYEPFWRTGDFYSSGYKCKIVHHNDPLRVVHLASINEYFQYLELCFDADIQEIYEQYPLLPIKKTAAIANELGISHPRYQDTKIFRVMTTDFYCIKRGGQKIAIAVKPEKSLSQTRTIEKILIEQAYWELDNVAFLIAQDVDLKTIRSRNLELLFRHRKIDKMLEPIYAKWSISLLNALRESLNNPLKMLIALLATKNDISYLLSSSFFLHGIWTKKIGIDLDTPLHFELKVSDLGVKIIA